MIVPFLVPEDADLEVIEAQKRGAGALLTAEHRDRLRELADFAEAHPAEVWRALGPCPFVRLVGRKWPHLCGTGWLSTGDPYYGVVLYALGIHFRQFDHLLFGNPTASPAEMAAVLRGLAESGRVNWPAAKRAA